jgi:hypothetical protein
MNSHLSKARSCAWYEKGKLRALGINDIHDPAPSPPHDSDDMDDSNWDNYDPQQDPDVDMEFGPYEDDFHFITTKDSEPEAGPGPQTQIQIPILEDDDDQRFIQIDEDAGRIYRQDPPPRHCQVDEDGDTSMGNSPFFPFASELDWRVAQWAVKDGPGHNAFNRLLEIPGVNNLIDFL